MSEAEAAAGSPAALVHPHDAYGRSLVGQRIGGRYVVDDVLGRGGMGVVVSATYADLAQRVAIKVMFPEHASDATLAKRFMREAKLAAKLRSPNLVRVTDVGSLDGGEPYFVMELLAGHDLHKELATRGPLPVEDAAEYVLQAATGLAELHAQGIVHRDLKNGNLFLAKTATGVEVKVLDYGISKDPEATTNLTATDALMGTPSHMSPEQITTPREVDARSDIWSLGIILYELLSKSLPYDVEVSTVGELFGLVLFSDPIPLRARRADVPEALEHVVMKCLRRKPADRWENVGELAAALAPFARKDSAHRVVTIARILSRPPPAQATPPFGSGASAEPETRVAGPKRQNSKPVPAEAPTGAESAAGLPKSSRSKTLVAAFVVVAVGVGAALAMRTTPAPAPVATPEGSPARAAPPTAPNAPPSEPPSESPALTTTPPSASTPPAVARPASPPTKSAPRASPPSTPSTPPRASVSPGPQELILDRR